MLSIRFQNRLSLKIKCLVACAMLIAAFHFSCRAMAQKKSIDESLVKQVEKLASTVSRNKKGALVIGITNGEQHKTVCIGTIKGASVVRPDEKTIFEIASITKVFTGILLTELWRENKLSFNDNAEKLLPKTVSLPQKNGKLITVFQLATHTSGLPANPDNMNNREKYGIEQFHQFLANCKLEFLPGEKYSYSNVGYRLIGEIIESVSQETYEQFLKEKILEPLGLNETKLRIAPEAVSRLAVGHDENGAELQNAPFSGGAAGGLKSTTEDMYKLLDCIIKFTPSNTATPAASRRIAENIIEMCKRRAKTKAGQSTSCIAWLRDDALDVYGKNGMLNGTSSYVGFSPKRKLGIIVFSSSAEINASVVFRDVYKILKAN